MTGNQRIVCERVPPDLPAGGWRAFVWLRGVKVPGGWVYCVWGPTREVAQSRALDWADERRARRQVRLPSGLSQ